ncbi:membrane protein insertase YidC [Thalassolituus sp. LLYu03]|uniref:membrane protein insertase YidC n=1 Tax=Thalassolituus sp. LLYu03 TaxID=3421656 RepID=UPI003D2D2CF8
MDIRRTVIFIGLAITSYLLILAWNGDYGVKPQDAVPVTESSVISPDLPDTTADEAAHAADAPQIEGRAAEPVVQATGELIRVSTDVLNVVIDPRGGEVVEVRLPQYPTSVDHKDIPFTVLERNERRLYVAQSGLLGADGPDAKGTALYSSEATAYSLADDQNELQVVLTTRTDKALVEKVFTFRRGDYLMDVNFRITNQSAEAWQGVFYAQLKRDGSADPSKTSSMGMSAYLGAALTTKENRYKKVTFSDLEEGSFKAVENGGWAAILQHYFLSAWVPAKDVEHTYNGRAVKGNYIFGFYDAPTVVAAGETKEVGASLYVGPKDQDSLAKIADNLNLTVDYGWLWWIAQPLFWLLEHIHALVGNWGVAIILLTVLVKAIFFKLSAASYRSMANMRKVAPKMAEIKEKYGDNREKLGQEMMALYKKEKINPLGGCLPILVQMPVFISLYWVLMESVELRQAPFFLWIHDMSVMDPYFVLPLIMGASMFLQMKLNPTPPDPMQARVMQFMPIIFTVFFLWFPAGLVLYWVTNNILSITQQYVITKSIEKSA